MIGGLRLIDAVAVAAVALLGLKGLHFAMAPRGEAALPPPSGVTSGAETLPDFARPLAYARTNYLTPDVAVTSATPDKTPPKAADPKAEAKPAPPAAEPSPRPSSPAERALLERLGERRDELQQRSRDIEMRERLLENAERKLESRLNELKGAEERADGASAKRTEADAGLKNLVTMYETMKPKDAARVFDRLPHDVLVPVVLQMNPRKMAEVLAVMAPEAAEKLTIALASRARIGGEKAAAALPPTELPAIDAPPRR